MVLNIDDLKDIKCKVNYVFQNADYEQLCINTDVLDGIDHVFSNVVEGDYQIQDQKNAGTCWIYAGIAMCRRNMIKKLKLASSFTLSVNHLIFWDKMEKVNYFIDYIINHSDLDDDGVSSILQNPIADGGNWEQFVHLVNTYGLIPETVSRSRFSSKNSKNLNKLIKSKLREFAARIMSPNAMRSPGSSGNSGVANEYMIVIYRLLCTFMGSPYFPDSSFTWTYMDSSDKKHLYPDLTPLTFCASYMDLNLNDYIMIIHDPRPRHPYNKAYTKTNDSYGTVTEMLNLPLAKIKPLITKQLDEGIPIWFGCDINYFVSHKHNVMDLNLYDYPIQLGLSKADRLDFCDSYAHHAMAIIGYDSTTIGGKRCANKRAKFEHNEVTKFMVENSWGKNGDHEGIYSMSLNWFEMFCYEFVINRQFIDEKTLRILDEPVIHFDNDDPFG